MFIKFVYNANLDSPYEIIEVDSFVKMAADENEDVYLRLSKDGFEIPSKRIEHSAYIMNSDGKTIDRIDSPTRPVRYEGSDCSSNHI